MRTRLRWLAGLRNPYAKSDAELDLRGGRVRAVRPRGGTVDRMPQPPSSTLLCRGEGGGEPGGGDGLAAQRAGAEDDGEHDLQLAQDLVEGHPGAGTFGSVRSRVQNPWAIRGLLKAADGELAGALRAVLRRDDDYMAASKPACGYGDARAREALVDALAKDAGALLGVLEGQELGPALAQAAELLATVTGQDLDQDAAGVFKIARRVARDRVISTVDPQARHGRKTSHRSFDGYKGHIAADPILKSSLPPMSPRATAGTLRPPRA